jgi:tRNA (guanine37-N1)-methyltransferase
MGKPWKVWVLTLFPEMFPGPLGQSLLGAALEKGSWELNIVDIRDFGTEKHQNVDDRPFGGGSGMVMRPDVLGAALDSALEQCDTTPPIIYFSPRGEVFKQAKAHGFLEHEEIIFICGRYEGIDERVISHYNIEEVSLGDFVLSGGEIPAMTVIDACVRLISGVLGNPAALDEESFGEGKYAGLLEYPHYTRPAEWKGHAVPDVLVSGNHAEIEKWRVKKAKEITKERRQDLWDRYNKQS